MEMISIICVERPVTVCSEGGATGAGRYRPLIGRDRSRDLSTGL